MGYLLTEVVISYQNIGVMRVRVRVRVRGARRENAGRPPKSLFQARAVWLAAWPPSHLAVARVRR